MLPLAWWSEVGSYGGWTCVMWCSWRQAMGHRLRHRLDLPTGRRRRLGRGRRARLTSSGQLKARASGRQPAPASGRLKARALGRWPLRWERSKDCDARRRRVRRGRRRRRLGLRLGARLPGSRRSGRFACPRRPRGRSDSRLCCVATYSDGLLKKSVQQQAPGEHATPARPSELRAKVRPRGLRCRRFV